MIKQPSVSFAPNTSCHPQHALARAAAGSARSRRTSCLHLAVLHVGRHSHRRHARALCSHEAFFAKNNTNHDTKLSARKYFELEMSVRDCELDQYGVVNNVVYASYVERGFTREELVEFLGVSASTAACRGNAMAVSEQNFKYFIPMKRGDKFVVKVTIQIKGIRIYAEQYIETLPDRKLVLEAKATIVCLNREFRPTRVFPELSSMLLDFFSPQES